MAMTKKEIINLRAEFQKLCDKIESREGPLPHAAGLKLVDAEIGKTGEGPPTILLRQLGQLLKHYIDEVKKKPNAVSRFNVAAGLVVDKGLDVQMAIRRARVALDSAVREMEADGLCDAKTHTALRVDKHDRVLNEILNT